MALTENQQSASELTDQYLPVQWAWNGWKPPHWRVWAWPNKQRRVAQLLLAVVGLPIGLFLCCLGRGDRHSPGTLSDAHAPWQANCNACHGSLGSEVGGSDEAGWLHKVDSRKCQACHFAQPHHAQTKGHEASCVSCHREHQGRHHALARPKDEHCVRCHQSLPNHVPIKENELKFASRITGFSQADGHPEFQPVKAGAVDPGRLKFSHALHLRSGLQAVHDQKPFGPALTYNQIPKRERARYLPKDADEKAAVQLNCSACHQWDSLEVSPDIPHLPNGRWPVRGDGAYALPIVYEAHCKACHPLTFDRQEVAAQLPHRMKPPDVTRFLKNRYLEEYLRDDSKVLERLLPVRKPLPPLPGKHLPPESVKVIELIDARIAKAEKLVWQEIGTCGKCHYSDRKADQIVPERIVPPKILEVWFSHAKFSHKVHRGMECRACHPNAFALQNDGLVNANASTKAADILIPGIDTCLQCHGTAVSAPSGFVGARGNCTQCHLYHHGDQPLAGRGGATHAPKEPLGIKTFQGR